jgi:hypothetical protein
MKTSLRTFETLSVTDRRLLFNAFVVVAMTRLALTLLPSRLIIRAAVRISSARPGVRTRGLDARRITWAVERVSLRIPGATCLTQALSAHMLLWRHGHPSRICLGVARTEQGDFRAHAWLESQGRIIIGADGVATLTRLPELFRNSRFTASQDPQ